MNRKVLLSVGLTVILIGIFTSAFSIQPVKAIGTIYIRADGSIEPSTANITSVDNVTYTLTGNISESIVMERDNIVIDGAGYTVDGTGSGIGIDLSHRTNVTVKNTEVINFRRGIFLVDSCNNTLTGNTVANSRYYGVLLYDSSNNTLRSNNMTDNGYNFGVDGDELLHFLHDIDASNLVDGKPVCYLSNQHDLVINSSTFPNIGYLALVNSTKITVENLTLTNNWQGLMLAYTTNSSIIGNTGTNNYYGIKLFGSSNNTIEENTEADNQEGIWLDSSANNTLSDNTITNNYIGIDLHQSCNHNTLSGNTIKKNTCGIWLYDSSNNTIAGNTVADGYMPGEYGIQLRSSSSNTLWGNTITNNWYGILLSGSYNTLRNNIMTGNEKTFKVSGSTLSDFLHNIDVSNLVDGKPIYYWVNQHDAEIPLDAGYIALVNCTGITVQNLTLTGKWQGLLLAYTSNSSIMGNTIANNEDGIWLCKTSNNVFFHNNFINNEWHQVFRKFLNESNTWDDGYPSGGNYWSDHVCTGNPNDGSQPYIIDENNIDHYPFQDPTGWLLHQLTVTSSPITGMTFTINGVPHTTPYTEWLLEGSYTIIMPKTHNGYVWSHWLEDGDPNRTKTVTIDINITLTGVFTPDTTPPTISIVSPENQTYPVEDVSLTFSVSEPTSWIGYSLDCQMNVTISGNTTIVELSDGTHTIAIYANDTAGNMGSSHTVYFNIDTTAPSISIVSPENKTYDTTDILLNFTVDESVSWMAYSLDNNANVTITGNTTLSGLSDGSHSLIVYARDTAGNRGASDMVYFSVETPQPEPFPVEIVAVIGIIAIVGAVVIVYFMKLKK